MSREKRSKGHMVASQSSKQVLNQKKKGPKQVALDSMAIKLEL